MNRLKKKISKRHSRTKRRHRRTLFRGRNAQVGGDGYLPDWLSGIFSSKPDSPPTTTVATTIQPVNIDTPIPSPPPEPSTVSTALVTTTPTESTPAPPTVGGGRRYKYKKTNKRGKSGYVKKTMKKHRRY